VEDATDAMDMVTGRNIEVEWKVDATDVIESMEEEEKEDVIDTMADQKADQHQKREEDEIMAIPDLTEMKNGEMNTMRNVASSKPRNAPLLRAAWSVLSVC